jgi:putative transposase
VLLANCTTTPDGAWVTQQARNLVLCLDDKSWPVRLLIHDRDAKFPAVFDGVFKSEGIEVIRTPIRAPRANAFTERWVRTIRSECLDWLLIPSCRHLQRVLRTYVDHYTASALNFWREGATSLPVRTTVTFGVPAFSSRPGLCGARTTKGRA